MSTRNSRNNRPLNPDDLIGFRTNARSSLQSYKESAASAAANCFLLWRDTQSKFATREGKEWITNEIKIRNEKITEHNDEVKKDEKRVSDYKADKLPKDDFIFSEPKSSSCSGRSSSEAKRPSAAGHRRNKRNLKDFRR